MRRLSCILVVFECYFCCNLLGEWCKYEPLVLEFFVLSAHQITLDVGLEQGDDLRQTLVTHILKHTQYTSLEEDFGGTKTVFVGVHLESGQELVSNNFAVNESLGNGVGGQDGVSAGRETTHI